MKVSDVYVIYLDLKVLVRIDSRDKENEQTWNLHPQTRYKWEAFRFSANVPACSIKKPLGDIGESITHLFDPLECPSCSSVSAVKVISAVSNTHVGIRVAVLILLIQDSRRLGVNLFTYTENGWIQFFLGRVIVAALSLWLQYVLLVAQKLSIYEHS